MRDVMKEKLNPLVENSRRIKIVLGYWVFCILQSFVKQEKYIITPFEYFFFFKISGKAGSAQEIRCLENYLSKKMSTK